MLLLFNLAGYRLLFNFLKEQSNNRLEYLLDKEQYIESQLFTIKVDLSMPYQPDETNFERANGEIEIDGKVYRFVKRRISNGQLVLLCIADASKTKLQVAERTFTEWSQDLQGKKGDREHGTLNNFSKILMSDYDFRSIEILPGDILITSNLHRKPFNEILPTVLWLKSPKQPPDTDKIG